MKPTLLSVFAAWLVGCHAAVPPERLVEVDLQLDRRETSELAVTQPGLIGEARVRRDAGWRAFRAGQADEAQLEAAIAWQKLRIAENLDAIGQAAARAAAKSASESAETAPGVGVQAGPPPDASKPTTTASPAPEPPPSGPGAGPVTTTPSPEAPDARRVANAAVQEAEDARIRLVATPAARDARWPEAEVVLQTAQRALERGAYDRAGALATRALFLFDVVRLSSPPPDALAASTQVSQGPVTGGAARRAISPPSKAFLTASLRVSRLRPLAESLGCAPALEAAQSLLLQAEGRRTSGDPGGADASVALGVDHLRRCETRLAKQVAQRITPTRDTLLKDVRALGDPKARRRALALLADVDAAVSFGDLDGADTLLREALAFTSGATEGAADAGDRPVAAAKPERKAPPSDAPPGRAKPPTPASPTAGPPTASAATATPAGLAKGPGAATTPPTTAPPTIAVTPVVGFGFGGSMPDTGAPDVAPRQPATPGDASGAPASRTTPARPGGAPTSPRSRIVSERVEPLEPPPSGDTGPDSGQPPTK